MSIKFQMNTMQAKSVEPIALLDRSEVNKALDFHAGFPDYQPTPLANLSQLAQNIGVGGIHVKDESHRFGLNAFKVLGGSFAIGKYIAQMLGKDVSELGYQALTSPSIREQIGTVTFATTTDGNHGRGVAWTANRLRQQAVVYMPKGTQSIRLEHIRSLGAKACITDMNYDDTVRMTAQQAQENNWIVVQDTAWEGYTDIPGWIMQGYATMGLEAIEQLRAQNIAPTHIFLQAGVGSMAAAILGLFANIFTPCPRTVIVEAEQAACFYKSATMGDGNIHNVDGDLATIMAGLACGEINPTAWEIIRKHATLFASCPDWVAADGMRILGNPLVGDERVISGESGAATAGLLHAIMTEPAYAAVKKQLALDEYSQILLFSTEGDTDPQMYRRIVWNGEYAAKR